MLLPTLKSLASRIVEHVKTHRLTVDSSRHDGRTPRTAPSTSGAEHPSTRSLINAATENSTLLRGPAIVEYPNGAAEHDRESQSNRLNTSGGAENRHGASYGAVATGSPPRY